MLDDQRRMLAQAEAIARKAKSEEIERLVHQAERSGDATLISLAAIYRKLNFGYY